MNPALGFLTALYSKTQTGHIALWTLQDRKTRWFPVTNLASAAQSAASLSKTKDVYFGVGLQKSPLGSSKRGEAAGVIAIPGLWADMDVAGPAHKSEKLPPSTADAVALAKRFPMQPTLIVHSGHGIQVYWSLKEPWVFENETERQAARTLSDRFQATLKGYAAEQGWQIDSTSDLSRVLRVPGTWNRKLETAVPVVILEQNLERRYNRSEFEPHLAEACQNEPERDQPDHTEEQFKNSKPADVEPILEDCGWLRHCRDDASTLPEPEWFGMLSIVGRCEDGEQLVQDFSRPHPNYSPEETKAKLLHALQGAGPRTCAYIRNSLNGEPYCSHCPHWGKIKSPIVLGNEVIRRVGGYEAARLGMTLITKTKDGDEERKPLTNFVASITADIVEDDGAEKRRLFEIEGQVQGKPPVRFTIPAREFPTLNWVPERLGARAAIFPGQTKKDHTRVAMQLLSGSPPERTVYTHLGFHKVGSEWIFLHADGAIGARGSVRDIEVSVPDLKRFQLPEPPPCPQLVQAVLASLSLLDIGPDRITVPIVAAAYRAPLGAADFSIYIHGKTGQGKSELAALCQQHFGAKMNRTNLPASWSSTANSTELLAFKAKDVILTVDDFVPQGSVHDIQRLHGQADRLLRNQGNRAGRQRMRSDGSLAATRPPRGLIVSTGEDIPRGESLGARLVLVEVRPGDIKWNVLTSCQQHAANGLYAQAMAGFIQAVAPRLDAIKAERQKQIQKLRQELSSKGHKKSANNFADLALGIQALLQFAYDIQAITEVQKKNLWHRCWATLTELAGAQDENQQANDPARRFVELLSAAIASGEAHIADTQGNAPEDANAWGWRKNELRVEPKGQRVGWIDGDDLYVNDEAAYQVVQMRARAAGDTFPVGLPSLRKRLRDADLIQVESEHRGGKQITRLQPQRTCEGRRQRVLCMKAAVLGFGEPDPQEANAA